MQLHHAFIAGACEPATRLRIARSDASTNEREARFRRDSCARRTGRWRRRRLCIGLMFRLPRAACRLAASAQCWPVETASLRHGGIIDDYARNNTHSTHLLLHAPYTPPCVVKGSGCGKVGRNMACAHARTSTGRWYQHCPQAAGRGGVLIWTDRRQRAHGTCARAIFDFLTDIKDSECDRIGTYDRHVGLSTACRRDTRDAYRK
jgi:hypothetical protein